MIPSTDPNIVPEKYLLVEPLTEEDEGRYFVSSKIEKDGCVEEIDFSVTVNTETTVNFPAVDLIPDAALWPNIWDGIRSKKNMTGTTPIHDLDLHDIIDVRFYAFDPAGANPTFPYMSDQIEPLTYIDYDIKE